ncbi:unnamed protein product, partial [Ectocarpus sp. 12 AP-2014]
SSYFELCRPRPSLRIFLSSCRGAAGRKKDFQPLLPSLPHQARCCHAMPPGHINAPSKDKTYKIKRCAARDMGSLQPHHRAGICVQSGGSPGEHTIQRTHSHKLPPYRCLAYNEGYRLSHKTRDTQ